MAEYLLSVHTTEEAAAEPMSEERMQELMTKIGELEKEMSASDSLVASGRLAAIGEARVVRAGDGETLTTDGPFAETKEHIAGFYIVNAQDLDAALRWGSKTSSCIGQPIEVRAFAGFELTAT